MGMSIELGQLLRAQHLAECALPNSTVNTCYSSLHRRYFSSRLVQHLCTQNAAVGFDLDQAGKSNVAQHWRSRGVEAALLGPSGASCGSQTCGREVSFRLWPSRFKSSAQELCVTPTLARLARLRGSLRRKAKARRERMELAACSAYE